MNKFETNICPICNNTLKYLSISKVNVYRCPTVTDTNKPHYEVEFDESISVQHMYFHPYSIENFKNSSKSRIFKSDNGKFKFIAEINQIKIPQENVSIIFNDILNSI